MQAMPCTHQRKEQLMEASSRLNGLTAAIDLKDTEPCTGGTSQNAFFRADHDFFGLLE